MEQQGLPGFFHVVARYGYNETVVQDATFVQVWHLSCASPSSRLPPLRIQRLEHPSSAAASTTAACAVEHSAAQELVQDGRECRSKAPKPCHPEGNRCFW